MAGYLLFLFAMLLPFQPGSAQEKGAPSPPQRPSSVQEWATRLERFGKFLPQEKVFLHTDNTCYFAGDTLWFKAYVTRSDTRLPSRLSEVLYVELLNPEGYLYERQLIRLQQGQGHGSIVLNDTVYGGYYELRAYTRWMLNWGEHEHPHTPYAEQWFYNQEMAKEYYRDYDKLYSRVFPIYDKPQEPGDYARDMTSRPLTRYFKSREKQEEAVLTLYPEGGALTAGTEARIAFEAATREGRHLEGRLVVTDAHDNVVAEATTEHRGRGTFQLSCATGERYRATFSSGELTARADLPQAHREGCTMRIEQADGALQVHVQATGLPPAEALGLTVMSNGVFQMFCEISPATEGTQTVKIPLDELAPGVNQLTVFDANGRIYADRLCFVYPESEAGILEVEGVEPSYEPFAPISLTVRKRHGTGGGNLSLAVRDAATSEYVYDNGTLLTEMLLASEVRGFIEQPGYYFERNDSAHRRHLDLLLMVQGWRRFDWHTMTEPNAFVLKHPYEKTQYLNGTVYNYTAPEEEDLLRDIGRADLPTDEPQENKASDKKTEIESDFDRMTKQMRETMTNADRTVDASNRFHQRESTLKQEVTVHAEFVQPGSPPVMGEMMTERGRFNIQAPLFEENCILFLAAADTTRLKKKEKPYNWVSQEEQDYAPFYVRLTPFYPNFATPYTYYRQSLPPLPKGSVMPQETAPDERLLSTVTVRTQRGGKRSFLYSKPAVVVDAYEAFNRACDQGFATGKFIGAKNLAQIVARSFVGDMGLYRGYKLTVRYDRRPESFNMSPTEKDKYNRLHNLDKLYIYTDYAPRREGDERYESSNQPEVIVDVHRIPNEGQRVTYRDRRYILPGFAICEDFYHPDYSRCSLPDPQDYRRTLYWNPDLPLDEEGRAKVLFFNNNKTTQIAVSAEGFGVGTEWLSGSSMPEDR